MNTLDEVQAIAKRNGLRVMPKSTSTGAPRCWLVYRDTVPRLTYLGERCSEKSLLSFVRSVCPR